MNAFLEYLVKYVQLLRISDLIDILIVSVIVYYLINLIRTLQRTIYTGL